MRCLLDTAGLKAEKRVSKEINANVKEVDKEIKEAGKSVNWVDDLCEP